jgi:cell division protein FtsL
MLFAFVDQPLVLAGSSFVVMMIVVAVGRRVGAVEFGPDTARVLDALRGATLTVLAVILGFALSMAVARYDQRRATEAEEGNTVGTEYSRLAILPSAETDAARAKLAAYAKLRIAFYETADEERLAGISAKTDEVQASLLQDLYTFAASQPTAIAALAVSGMNAVVDARGMTDESFENRMPLEVWAMLTVFGLAACFLMSVGFPGRREPLVWLTPAAVAIVLFLVADIESARHGLVIVKPYNLEHAIDAPKA